MFSTKTTTIFGFTILVEVMKKEKNKQKVASGTGVQEIKIFLNVQKLNKTAVSACMVKGLCYLFLFSFISFIQGTKIDFLYFEVAYIYAVVKHLKFESA